MMRSLTNIGIRMGRQAPLCVLAVSLWSIVWSWQWPSPAQAAPVTIPAAQAVGPPRREGGDGICATVIHDMAAVSGAPFSGVDQAAAQISQQKGQGLVDGKIARIFPNFNLRNADVGTAGDFPDSGKQLFPFSGDPMAVPPGDDRDIALRARGYLTVERAGVVTVAVNAYDGHRLIIGGVPVTESVSSISARITQQVAFAAPGLYPLELVYYHNGSVAVLEVSQADGAQPEGTPIQLDTSLYHLWATAQLYSSRVDRVTQCLECTGGGSCPQPGFCGDGICQQCNTPDHCGPSCAACGPQLPLCASSRCVECAADADCPPGLVCDAVAGACQGGVPCRISDECPGGRVCDPVGGVCITPPVACTADGQCRTGQYCDKTSGVCMITPTQCMTDAGCPASQLCDPGQRVCRARQRGRYVGGCALGRRGEDPAGPGAILFAGLCLLLMRLSRRRVLLAGVFFCCAGLPSEALAQLSQVSRLSVNALTFHPALGPDNVITVEGSRTPGHLQPIFAGLLEFAYRPLRLVDPQTGDILASTVPSMTTLHVMAGLGLFRWLSAGVDLPLVLYQGFDERTPVLDVRDAPASFGVGDLRLVVKVRFLDNGRERGGLGLAFVPQVTFPTGRGQDLRGDDAFGIEPRFALDYRFPGGAFLAANLGFLGRTSDRAVRDMLVTHQVRYGLGGYLPIISGFGVAAELGGGVAVSSMNQGPVYAPTEIYLGARWVHRSGLTLNLGGGSGLTDAVGSPPFRLFGGIGYLPVAGGPRIARRPAPPDAVDGVDLDPDRDGLVGAADRCPLEPGPAENHGCPDKDTDGDGLVDRLDRCPKLAGLPESQGCPEADSDGDGVPDRMDDCPLQPGLRDNRGCPDRDLDHDGVPDRLDRCPADPGPPPTGCPQRKFIAVQVDKIDLKQKIHFATDRSQISAASYGLLDEIVEVLRQRPTMELAIEGHTDNVGDLRHNMQLSEQRASEVRGYLVHAGIDGRRLLARGFGPTRPTNPNDTPHGREQNRRTEFVVTHQ